MYVYVYMYAYMYVYNCTKWASRGIERAIWRAGSRIAQNAKTRLQRLAESCLASKPQNCSKWASRGILRAIWRACPRIAQNEPPEAS